MYAGSSSIQEYSTTGRHTLCDRNLASVIKQLIFEKGSHSFALSLWLCYRGPPKASTCLRKVDIGWYIDDQMDCVNWTHTYEEHNIVVFENAPEKCWEQLRGYIYIYIYYNLFLNKGYSLCVAINDNVLLLWNL